MNNVLIIKLFNIKILIGYFWFNIDVMINIVINVIKLNVIENIGIYNVDNFKNNVNFELNVVLFVNFNVKLFVNVLFKIV